MERFKCDDPDCKNDAKLFAVLVAADGSPYEVAFCPDHYHEIHINWALADLTNYAARRAREIYEECAIHAVLSDYLRDEWTVVLKSRKTTSALVVPTGYPEAAWIANVARQSPYRNTPTHQLIVNIISALGGSVSRAVVHGYDAGTGTYLCQLSIGRSEGSINVNCRVSDAIAIALFAKIPIMVNEALLGELLPGSSQHWAGGNSGTPCRVVVTQDEDGLFAASCPSLPGSVGHGATLRAAVAKLQATIAENRGRRDDGRNPPSVPSGY